MKTVTIISLLLTFLAITISASAQPGGEQELKALKVPLAALIANPEKYDRQRILVHGYVRLDFEDRALYLTKNDADYEYHENSVWIGEASSSAKPENIENLKKGFVLVEGVFHKATDKRGVGHFGNWSGEIT